MKTSFKKIYENSISDSLKDKLSSSLDIEPETIDVDDGATIADKEKSDIEKYKIDDVDTNEISKAIQEQHQNEKKVLSKWIDILGDMITFLNDPSTKGSIPQVVNASKSKEGTMLADVQLNRISAIASSLASFRETLKASTSSVEDTITIDID